VLKLILDAVWTALQNFARVLKYKIGERIPEVIDFGEFFKGYEFSAQAFLLHSDLDQVGHSSGVAVGPPNFTSLCDVVAANVLNILEDGSCFFNRLTLDCLEARFERFDSP
jgi:hypothetical protein